MFTKEKVILITGSTDGIGYQTAIELAKSGHHLIVHGRNKEKAETAMKKVEKASNNKNLSFVYADLGSFAQIKEMVNYLYNNSERLDVLINNAGVIRPERKINNEGLEETFGVNYVAPFLLSNLLIELLNKGKSNRIVNVVSRVQSNHLDFEDLQLERGYSSVKAYAKSKTALILFTYLLAEKLKDKDISVNCLHPGVINTKLLRTAFGAGGAPLIEGAKTLIYAATAPELKKVSGKYFVNNRPETSVKITYNKEVQKTLWKKSEEILGTSFGEY